MGGQPLHQKIKARDTLDLAAIDHVDFHFACRHENTYLTSVQLCVQTVSLVIFSVKNK